jgi:hypothetical protein
MKAAQETQSVTRPSSEVLDAGIRLELKAAGAGSPGVLAFLGCGFLEIASAPGVK